MGAIASQITRLTIVYSTVYSDADERKHHRPLSGEFTGDRWIPRTNGQLRGKCFHLITSLCEIVVCLMCIRDFYQYYQAYFSDTAKTQVMHFWKYWIMVVVHIFAECAVLCNGLGTYFGCRKKIYVQVCITAAWTGRYIFFPLTNVISYGSVQSGMT